MRGQWLHCFRSVTSNNCISVCMNSSFFPSKTESLASFQVALAERNQAHLGRFSTQDSPDLEQKLLLERTWQVAPEGTVLDSLQTIVQAQISNLCACPVLADIV